ncbi:MAG TPA: heavy metal-binding domain-containing protein, partial [Acidisarcina sp.]
MASTVQVPPPIIDPVCGMTVDPAKAKNKAYFKGKTFYFCGASCLKKYEADPARFADGYRRPAESTAAPLASAASVLVGSASKSIPVGAVYTCPMDPEVREGKPGPCRKCGMALDREGPVLSAKVDWTCPMHPQISRDGPGSCPICGMALELRESTADDGNPELDSMTRRFWSGVGLTLPLLALMVSDVLPSQPILHWIGPRTLSWLQFALATPVVLWGGAPFFER